MIIIYRILGSLLLFLSSSGFCSLIAKYNPEYRIPMFWLAVIASGVLAACGAIFYSSRELDEEWGWKLGTVSAIAICFLIGGIIQWM